MADDVRLEQISAALDGEGPMPADLDEAERGFVENALRLRGVLRVVGADTPPDVTDAVLRRVTDQEPGRRRPALLVAAAVFVVAAVAGMLAVRPGGPVAPEPAAADVAERVIEGQRSITSFLAEVTVVEANVHPDVAERTLHGTLRYEAPERLRFELRQQSAVPDGWPSNDIELVIDAGTAWRRGLDDCPVGAQPGCLRSSQQVVRDLAPFSPTWISPLDLVVPADAFLPMTTTTSSEEDRTVVIDTTAARVDRLVDGLTSAGAIRSVHATDHVRLELDAETLTLRRLSVQAADNPARANWAATNGYEDVPGSEVLRVDVEPTDLPDEGSPVPPSETGISAGFVDRTLEPAWSVPPGFTLHRSGRLHDGGPRSDVYAYSDGRAWIRVDVTDEWDQPRLFGGLGPLVRQVDVGAGVGYTDPAGTKLALHTAERDIVLTGSVELEVLVETAAAIADGVAMDDDWAQAAHVDVLPQGALVPPGGHLAVSDGDDLVIAVGGPGATDLLLRQAPADALPPPLKGDVIETRARGVPARYSPRLGTLTWLEDGWRRELRGEGRDLSDLRAVADALVEP